MKNNEEVPLGPYSQKMFWKETNVSSQSRKFAEILRFWKNWCEIGQFLKSRATRPIFKIFGSGFLQTSFSE
jgi:hypothetical protein